MQIRILPKQDIFIIVTHMKVFFKGGDGKFKEFVKEDLEKPSEYYRTLKTAVVPFLASVSAIVDQPLTQGFKDAFDRSADYRFRLLNGDYDSLFTNVSFLKLTRLYIFSYRLCKSFIAPTVSHQKKGQYTDHHL